MMLTLIVTCCIITGGFQDDEYVFLPMKYKEAKFYVLDDKYMLIMAGYINKHGTFVSETILKKWDNRARKKAPFDKVAAEKVIKSESPKNFTSVTEGCINEPAYRNEYVYEFRSGKLIPGFLDPNCNFLPDPAQQIIDFKDYRYHATSQYHVTSQRIYNLPGKFVKKSQLKEEQAKITELESRKP